MSATTIPTATPAVRRGTFEHPAFADTWVWNGTTWRIPYRAYLDVSLRSGRPGTTILIRGNGFAAHEQLIVAFVDSVGGTHAYIQHFWTDLSGHLTNTEVSVPSWATVGVQHMTAVGRASRQKAAVEFTVTSTIRGPNG